jgi:hypothetical protein
MSGLEFSSESDHEFKQPRSTSAGGFGGGEELL